MIKITQRRPYALFQNPTSRVDPTKKPGFIDFSIDFQRFQARTLGALGASQRAFGRV